MGAHFTAAPCPGQTAMRRQRRGPATTPWSNNRPIRPDERPATSAAIVVGTALGALYFLRRIARLSLQEEEGTIVLPSRGLASSAPRRSQTTCFGDFSC